MQSYIVEIEGLRKSFGKNETKTEVLKGINLSIKQGEFCAVMGKSGCGKSTLLSIIAGLERADSGTCMVNGKNIQTLTEKELAVYRNHDIGVVFQAFYLDDTRTIMDTIEMPLGYAGFKKKYRKTKALEILENMDLMGLKHKYPSQLSGGEQQRVSIARAVINTPHILLADEPTGNLDEDNTKIVLELFQKLNAEGMTILMVTHDENAASYADRIINIKDGEVL